MLDDAPLRDPTHAALRRSCAIPSAPRPIVMLGTGGVASDAHLSAYLKAGFPVAGLYDPDRSRAEGLAATWNVPRAFASLEEAVGVDAVFDIAAPTAAHPAILRSLPMGATVLLQAPMGLDLAAATAIRETCRARQLAASVNFQLRHSAMLRAIRDTIDQGRLGALTEIEVRINVATPRHRSPNLTANPRAGIADQTVHYLDAIRALAGEPDSVFARSFDHPSGAFCGTRTSMILDYGPTLRCLLSINHHHDFGPRFQEASFRVEGAQGAVIARFGALLGYPVGEPDLLWLAGDGKDWEQVPLEASGTGAMAHLQRFAAGENAVLCSPVEDAWRTMALAEAAYRSCDQSGMPIPRR
ncbi:Gfo/Idh/MocA family protein [Sphingomonas sp. CJ20]